MPRGKTFTAEQIIGKPREADVGLAQGKTVPAGHVIREAWPVPREPAQSERRAEPAANVRRLGMGHAEPPRSPALRAAKPTVHRQHPARHDSRRRRHEKPHGLGDVVGRALGTRGITPPPPAP
jgi:hypothetical protein